LEDGDKVKVSVRFKGREIAYSSKGVDLLNRFAQKIADVGQIEKDAKLEGRSAVLFLKPFADKDKKQNTKQTSDEQKA